VAGATRPVGGGAYSGPRSEPGGQTSPRAGRSVASVGSYITVRGSLWQQIDQGDIFDEAAAGVVTASGSSVEDYRFDESGITTVTASGSGVEAATSTDVGSGTVTASGSSVEFYAYTDAGSGIATASGTGVESYDITDASSGTFIASGNGIESASSDDNSVGTVTASGSSTESYIDVDVGSGTATISGSGIESAIYSDSRSGTATVSGSGVEAFAPTYTDSASGTVTASGTGTESAGYSDSASGTVTTSGSGVESYSTPTFYDGVIDVDTPVSHWKLGGATTAVDRKGVRNLPAVNGPVASAATLIANNGADSSNTFVRASQQFFGTPLATGIGAPYESSVWSVEAWFKVASLGTTIGVVGRSDHQAIRIDSAAKIQLRWEDSSGVGNVLDAVNAVIGTTYHVVGTFDGADAILYVNGVEKARRATSSNTLPNAVPTIGSQNYGTPLAFNGTVDEVAWYTTVLSPARVLAHYRSGALLQTLRPDADIADTGWVVAPLYPKLSDGSDTTVVTGVLV
jgi:Concanavalin A-like lectin/glucanases superfamily